MQFHDLGELAQAEFLCDALKRGLIVSEPFGDNAKYDFIVDNGKKLLRIQVKSTSCYLEKKDCYQLQTSRGASKKELYNHHEIDFFACYIIPTSVWYLIPVYSVTTPMIRVYDKSETSKFSTFKENWNLLLS